MDELRNIVSIDLGYGVIKCASRAMSIDGDRVNVSRITTNAFLSRAIEVEKKEKAPRTDIKMAKNPVVEFPHPTERGRVCRYQIGSPDAPDFLSSSSRQIFWNHPEIYAMICYALYLTAKPNDSIGIVYGVPVGWLNVYKNKPERPPSVFNFSVIPSDDSSPKSYKLTVVRSKIGGQTVGGVKFILSNFPFADQLDDWSVIDIGYGTTDAMIMKGRRVLTTPISFEYGISNEMARQWLETGNQGELGQSAYSRIVARASSVIFQVARAYKIGKFFLIGGGGEVIASAGQKQMPGDIKICRWKTGFSPSDDIQVIVPPNPTMINCIGLLEMLYSEVVKEIKQNR